MYTGPNITTDGLVLSLDAANTKSYVSGSNVWRDLSGNGYAGSLINEPIFDSNAFGSILFDGINDYINLSSFPNLGNVFTINVVAKTGVSGNAGYLICPSSNNVDNGIYINASKMWFFGTETGDVNNFFVVGNTVIDTTNTRWYFFSATCNVNTVNIYVNGNNDGSTTTAFNIGSWSGANSSIGRRAGGGSSYFSGSISLVQAWNRVLSSTEISQIYNSQKSRFNL